MLRYGLLFFLFIPILPIRPLDVLLLYFNPLCWYWQMCPRCLSGCPCLILKLFCLSLLIEITKSIVGHFKAVLRCVFVIRTSVFVVTAFNRTPCHKMLISSCIVNVSLLYSLISAYTDLPLTTYLLPLISYRLLLTAYRLPLTAYKVITNPYLHIRYHLI